MQGIRFGMRVGRVRFRALRCRFGGQDLVLNQLRGVWCTAQGFEKQV